ncbi:hypothetical protein Zmor_004611 [Zophobas morio]|uniref:Uncharacterized protein n=1 Tax=Zophobas morio TaxID=2755281 RepID=A0AA38MKQ8_9CUCU|nr:hypothetical protein Zmor_004611 [Zophobas morio]
MKRRENSQWSNGLNYSTSLDYAQDVKMCFMFSLVHLQHEYFETATLDSFALRARFASATHHLTLFIPPNLLTLQQDYSCLLCLIAYQEKILVHTICPETFGRAINNVAVSCCGFQTP